MGMVPEIQFAHQITRFKWKPTEVGQHIISWRISNDPYNGAFKIFPLIMQVSVVPPSRKLVSIWPEFMEGQRARFVLSSKAALQPLEVCLRLSDEARENLPFDSLRPVTVAVYRSQCATTPLVESLFGVCNLPILRRYKARLFSTNSVCHL